MSHSVLNRILVIILILINTNFSFGRTLYSNGASVSWENAASWSPAFVPDCGDTIIIKIGDVVSVNTNIDLSGCAAPIFIEVYGTLHFSGGGSKLKLPSGSGVDLQSGGGITQSGSGGGSSRTLEIGSVTVWKASDGNISGPLGFGSPLPVVLKSFNAVYNDGKVSIYWTTASESNSSHYIIKRSKDGSIWDDVFRVEAAGNSSTEIEYFDFDSEPLYGVSYYKLVQYDNNGEFFVSNIVPVENLEGGLVAFDIFPNPTTSDNINLSFKGFEGKEVLVIMRDLSGKEYFSKIVVVDTKDEIIASPADSTIPAGIYIITATSENELYSQRIIIK
ncbi:MAG: T9SS type A sorting domain-containing protein [Flavobacteriales bacterium]|nr:T9SS type A sorting domain-containing protein [Flavobacteriales bacterium]